MAILGTFVVFVAASVLWGAELVGGVLALIIFFAFLVWLTLV